MDQLDELYQDLILDHCKNPRCQSCVSNPTSTIKLHNPLCGDTIEVNIKIENNYIKEISFSGNGCSISQASASMMSEHCKGKSLEEVNILCNTFRGMIRGEKSSEEITILGDSVSLEGVRKFSARIKCALLAWDVMEKCIKTN